MFVLLISLSFSVSIYQPGYYTAEEYNLFCTIDFKLEDFKNYNYYRIFSTFRNFYTDDDVKLSDSIYLINKLQYTLKIHAASNTNISFGIFLIPSTFNSLEFLIYPSSTASYTIKNNNNYRFQKYYLLILNDEPFNINISKGHKDYNRISYSRSGNLLRNETDLRQIPKTKILAIEYSVNTCPCNTTYKISSGKFQFPLNYYDSRGEPLVFLNKVSIGPLFDDTFLKAGYYHYNLTDTIYFNVSKNTIIIFSNYRYVHGYAIFEQPFVQYSTDILYPTNNTAIEFSLKGILELIPYEDQAFCDFMVYNYTTKSCDYTLVISGKQSYQIEKQEIGKLYCVFFAFGKGQINIAPKNSIYNAVNASGEDMFIRQVNEMTYDFPLLIISDTWDTKKNKITFETNTFSDDLNYTIDGIESKYSFIQANGPTSTKINKNYKVGSEIIKNNKWITISVILLGSIFVFTLIIMGSYYYIRPCFKHSKEGMELELIDQKPACPPNINESALPTFHPSTENNSFIDPYL
ncbi:hypothetical protein TVAG_090420 [Trichomonas vaginalis G3]|uniref:Uncharacterized protein n=1 Tax=Trichomonas vaginalis (strain ATCC PRA-98 / G3) TaxID=412133 RepID=A2F9Z9_TRIV3|nr:hypothetical protein TVAGG3_0730030 [Trichomonas vaginalis G3]EAX98266.1 hypothetical protein TVAG_090420 [Trichomonas vaginalis G3]KAI5511192.1 hypothetical protein TVAGG3_0730030 [Trichomonas vaginalis G3]|eukprot:XP_001311196.1 hypothetical protein [Trichomonas vaginalis G3]